MSGGTQTFTSDRLRPLAFSPRGRFAPRTRAMFSVRDYVRFVRKGGGVFDRELARFLMRSSSLENSVQDAGKTMLQKTWPALPDEGLS
jgi:hypothetical protein